MFRADPPPLINSPPVERGRGDATAVGINEVPEVEDGCRTVVVEGVTGGVGKRGDVGGI